MQVIKRDGIEEPYDSTKILNAVNAAFKSQGLELPDDVIKSILDAVSATDKEKLSVEEIQDIVIKQLFSNDRYFEVAKAYITYKEKHDQIRLKAKRDINFLKNFVASDNAADSTIDDNSNVGTKSIGVLNAEIHKEDNKNTNFTIWADKIKELYGIPVKQVAKDFDTIFYAHDLSSQVLMPYCMAVSMYPFLTDGLKKLGGLSAAPKSLESFCGIYINLVFALAGQVKGAVATPEVLMYFDHFAKLEWGDDYYQNADKIISAPGLKVKTIGGQINQYFQQISYSINQVAANRGMQSAFTNFSFFDKYFFEGMFGDFVFPDGDKPTWESVNWLQQRYLHWLNEERLKCILTFPVCSYACLTENGEFKDLDTKEFICNEYANGNSFFTYLSDTVDSLSSCCRLQNAISENTFNFTNGQIGIQTGSKQVITLNLNRIVQDWYRSIPDMTLSHKVPEKHALVSDMLCDAPAWGFKKHLVSVLDRVYKYLLAYNELLHWAKDTHQLFPAYDAQFIDLDKQYLTVGINGLNQAAEFLGMSCNKNEHYRKFCALVFSIIKEENVKHKTKHAKFNTEQVPAESAAVKLYNRDKADGYWVPSDTNLYASYIFKPNDEDISILDKFILHSKQFASDYLDGGAAAHINLSEHASVEQYDSLLSFAASVGCSYFTFNVPNCECEDCGFIAKRPFQECPKCGSTNTVLWDRIIGYLSKLKNWSKGRQIEQKTRVYS